MVAADPSSYMTNGAGELPAFPVRVACGYMTATPDSTTPHSASNSSTSSSSLRQTAAAQENMWLLSGG